MLRTFTSDFEVSIWVECDSRTSEIAICEIVREIMDPKMGADICDLVFLLDDECLEFGECLSRGVEYIRSHRVDTQEVSRLLFVPVCQFRWSRTCKVRHIKKRLFFRLEEYFATILLELQILSRDFCENSCIFEKCFYTYFSFIFLRYRKWRFEGGKWSQIKLLHIGELGWNRPKNNQIIIRTPRKFNLFCRVFLFSHMEKRIEHLEGEIEFLKARNTRVELEKAWETSLQRKIGIILTTYFVMILVFWSLGNDRPFLNAVVPTLGYTLSTFSMGWMKRLFLKSK